MAFNLNQFSLTNKAGKTMNVNPDTISVRVSKDAAASLIAGDAVVPVASEVGAAPVVDKAALGNLILGVVLENPRQASFAARGMCEIGLKGTIVTMVAGTALNRGDVYYIPSTGYVAGTSGVRIGVSLDVATAAGDIVRVQIDPKA